MNAPEQPSPASRPGNWGRWGSDDQRGTANLLTPERVAAAAGLVREGRVYPLAIPLRSDGPLWPGRHENWHVAIHQNVCGPGIGGAEDILMIHTHGSTHIDSLAHILVDGVMYNGYPAKEIDSHGTRKNAIDGLGAIVARGLLIDVAGARGVETLPAEHVVEPEEIESIAAAQGVEIREGDALLFRTGWLKVWSRDRDLYNRRQPGIGARVAAWAGERGIVAMGADNNAVEAYPVPGDFLPVHKEFLRDRGGYLLELLDLEALAADRVREFMFVVAPLRLARGLGSPVTPLAIR